MAKSELGLIEWVRRQVGDAAPGVLKGIGDDMAVLQLGAEKLLITCDMLLDGVHFDSTRASLDQIGYKALAVSLSDCAAMAALPLAAVVSVALPNSLTMADAEQLLAGIQRAATLYHCPLVGGDTTSWDQPLAIDVALIGRTDGIEPVLRSGARPGDAILVTGQLGGSLASRHLEFVPRIAEARLLAQMAPLHAMIDLSDGLSTDLGHICTESNVSALLDAAAIPISPAARQRPDPLGAALNDGEDFELLLCTKAADADTLLSQWPRHSDVPLSLVGHMIKPDPQNRLFLQCADQPPQPLQPGGYEHFRTDVSRDVERS